MSNADGGPAFPVAESNPHGDPQMVFAASYGMSLRDYFAAMAMQGQLSAYGRDGNDGADLALNRAEADLLAITSYNIADAMLAERIERNP